MKQTAPSVQKQTEQEEVVIRRQKKRSIRRQRLYSVKRRLTDPIDSNFYTEVEIFVPKPNLDYPSPIIMVFIQNFKGRVWFRAKSVQEIHSLLGNLNQQDTEGLEQALSKAGELEEYLVKAKGTIESTLEGF